MADSDNFKTDKYLEKMNDKFKELENQLNSLIPQINNLEDTLKKQVAKYKQVPTEKLKEAIQKNAVATNKLYDEKAKLEDEMAKNAAAKKKYTNALLEASKKAEQQSKQAERTTKTLYENTDMVKRNTAAKKKQEKATEDATKKVQQQNQEVNKQQKVQKQVTKELENYLKELKKRPDYKEINKGGAVTNAYTRSGGDFDKFKKLVEDRINRLARKDQSSQSELQKIKTAEIHTRSSKQNKEAVQEENKGNATNVINETVTGETPDNETVVNTNKEREKTLQNLEDYNKIFANIGSEEITLRQRILENAEAYIGHLNGLNVATAELVDSTNAQVVYGRQFATVLVKAVRGVGKINLPGTLGALSTTIEEINKELKGTKAKLRSKSSQVIYTDIKEEDNKLGTPKDIVNEARLKSGKKRSSVDIQKDKNQRRADQKGFIALLIPALAKLLHKTPIWDAIKLLLLKFGAKHPLMTAGALMAGPALIAGGIGLRAMGGLKGLGSVFNRSSNKTGSNIIQLSDRRTRVRVGRMLQAPGNYLNGLGSRAESNISNKILDLQNNRRALLDLQASKEARIPQLAAKEAKLVKQQQYAVRELLPLTSGKNLSYSQRARKVQLQQEVQKRYGKIKNIRAEIAGVQGNAAKLDPYLDSNLKAIDDLTRAQKRLKNPMWNLAEKLKVFGSDIGSVGKGFIKSIGSFAGKVKNIKFGELIKGGFGAVKGGFLKSINPMTAARAVGKLGKGAKVLGPIGTALTAVAEIPDLINAARSGKPGALKKQLVKSGGGIGGALVGGAIGSTLGPVGTVIGAIIGDIIGRIVGPALFDGFKVFTGKLGADFKGIWDGLKQTFGSAMRIITPIARLIGRMLVPSFKLLGFVLGGLVKAIVWTVKIVAKTLGWVADKIADVVESITKGLEWLGKKLLEIPVIGPALRKLYGTSGDGEEKPTEDTNNGATGTVDSAVSSNPRIGPIPGEDDQPQRYGGVPKNAKLYNVNGLQAVALKDLGLKGSIWSGNSKPFVGAQNGSNVQFLDGLLNKWGYGVTYTSGMGGNHAKTSGHYKGTKLDLQLTKNGRAAQLTPQQLEILRRYGYWGGNTGALGWEAVKGQAGGGHYDMYVAQGSSLRETGSVVPANGTEVATSSSNRAKQETSDGVREALLAFAGENKKDKDNQRTRNLIFQATDVTGSLGCWGITQVNNSGQMRH